MTKTLMSWNVLTCPAGLTLFLLAATLTGCSTALPAAGVGKASTVCQQSGWQVYEEA